MAQEKLSVKMIWRIFYTFFFISPATFGGGYAMIPLLEKAVIERNQWMKKEDITDVLAIAQTVPGSIAVNAATFIGYRLAGVIGAIAATIGMITPTFIIILVLASLFLEFQHYPIVQAAFLGIRPAIVALIFFAAVKTGKTAISDKTTGLAAALTVVVLLFTPVHPMFVILIGAFAGIALTKKKTPAKYKETDLDYYMGAGI